MKPFWRYGAAGKQRLIKMAFDEVKAGIDPMVEETAKAAVHEWLLKAGYFTCGGTKSKQAKFSDPGYFWRKNNYEKHLTYLAELVNIEFWTRAEAEMKQAEMQLEEIERMEKAQEAARIQAERLKWVYSYEEEMAGPYMQWVLWISIVYWGGSYLIGRKSLKAA